MAATSSITIRPLTLSSFPGIGVAESFLPCLSSEGLSVFFRMNRAWKASIETYIKTNFHCEPNSKDIIVGLRGVYIIKRRLTQMEAIALFYQTLRQTEFEDVDGIYRKGLLNKESEKKSSLVGAYVGIELPTRRFVAIKVIHNRREAIVRELAMAKALKNCDSSNIIIPFDACLRQEEGDAWYYYGVQELAGLGTLQNIIKYAGSLNDPEFLKRLQWYIAKSILTGLSHLHNNSVCHLDVKPDNVLFNAEAGIKLIDFDTATKMIDKEVDSDEGGAWDIFAPEKWLHMYTGRKCNGTKLDTWALGLILLQIMMGEEATKGFSQIVIRGVIDPITGEGPANSDRIAKVHRVLDEHTNGVLKKNFSSGPLPSVISTIVHLAQALLEFNPEKRLDAINALEAAWIHEGTRSNWEDGIKKRLPQIILDYKRKELADTRAVLSPHEPPLPPLLTTYIERRELQNKVDQFLRGSQPGRMICQGEMGTGKSSLIKFVLFKPEIQQRYPLQLWFRCGDRVSLIEDQYILLAKQLNKTTTSYSFSKAFQIVQAYLIDKNRPSWIVIFDNASTYAQMERFIPRGGKVILLTRTEQWPEITLRIKQMSEHEAVALADTLLKRTAQEHKILCEKVAYHPLSITFACAFMVNQGTSVANCLEQMGKIHLDLEGESLTLSKMTINIVNIWKNNIEMLEKANRDVSSMAQSLAYFSHDGMTEQILACFEKPGAIPILRQYGILEGDTNRMHLLLQLAIQHFYPKVREQAFTRAVDVLDKFYRTDGADLNQAIVQQVMAHADSLLKHATKGQFELSDRMRNACITIYIIMGELQRKVLNNPVKSLEYFGWAEATAKNLFGERAPRVGYIEGLKKEASEALNKVASSSSSSSSSTSSSSSSTRPTRNWRFF